MLETIVATFALKAAGHLVGELFQPEVILCGPPPPSPYPSPITPLVRDLVAHFVGIGPTNLDRHVARVGEKLEREGRMTREQVVRLRAEVRDGFDGLRLGQERIFGEVRHLRAQVLGIQDTLDQMESRQRVAELLLREQQVARNFERAWREAGAEDGFRLHGLLDLHGILADLAGAHDGLNFRDLSFPSQRGHQGPALVALAPDVTKDLDRLFWLLQGLRTAAAHERNVERLTEGTDLRVPDPIVDYVPMFEQQVQLVDAYRDAARQRGAAAADRIAQDLGPVHWRFWAAWDLYKHKCGEYDRCSALAEVRRVTWGHYTWWLWRTHMGLLHRTICEIEMARAGYATSRAASANAELVLCADVVGLLAGQGPVPR